ncbi:ABC-three component system middle component 1 [Chitinophaga sp. 30R24]|uniref:ABC-three component system middle component 1 n=1 Tax=Chitinophaga sp. 30R24 TaxID=3248838 RepID=UPI003B91B12C
MQHETLYKEVELDISQQLVEAYNCTEVKILQVNFVGNFFVIIVRFSSIPDLNESWRKINSVIAVKFSQYLKTEFEKYNLYLLFFVDEEVPKQLKYEIENNKFSSRKIAEKCNRQLTDDRIREILAQYITNSDISITPGADSISLEYTSDSVVWSLIKDQVYQKDKSGESFAEILNEIEKKLSYEI